MHSLEEKVGINGTKRPILFSKGRHKNLSLYFILLLLAHS